MSKVVTYANDERQCFCQIKFDSGERVLISVAGMPTPSIKIIQLAYFGMIPTKTIWEYNLQRAGTPESYVVNMIKMFPQKKYGPLAPLDIIRDTLLACKSTEEAHTLLVEREKNTL